MKMRLHAMLAMLTCLLMPVTASAHEFWLWPDSFRPSVQRPVRLTLQVGEYFEGETTPVVKDRIAVFRRLAKDMEEDLLAGMTLGVAAPAYSLSFAQAGTQLLAFDSHPAMVTLSADKFHAYLREEGLETIIALRERMGTANTPGRERFRRHVKTLLQIGGKTDASYARRAAQRLEILPINNPHALRAGARLKLKLLFEDRPLDKALVKAWHKREGNLVTIRARSNAQGEIAFDMPYAGQWMISVVHMTPANDAPDVEWDSFWGSLTFEIPDRTTKRTP